MAQARSLAEIDAELQQLGVDPSLLPPPKPGPSAVPTATPPQAAPPPAATAASPTGEAERKYGVRFPQPGEAPPTFMSTIPSMVLAGLTPAAMRAFVGPATPMIGRVATEYPLIARTIGSLIGALAGTVPGQAIQQSQGVPGPSLGQRMVGEIAPTMLGALAAEPTVAGARRLSAPFGRVPASADQTAGQMVNEAQQFGIPPSARGILPTERMTRLQTPDTTRMLAQGQSEAGNRFLGERYNASATAFQRSGSATAGAQVDFFDRIAQKAIDPATGITDLPSLQKSWKALGTDGQTSLFPNAQNRQLLDRFFKVAGQAVESNAVAAGAELGRSETKWQPVAALIGAGLTAAGLGGYGGSYATGTGALFLGTTGILTAQPHVVSWLMRRPWGVKWLTGALAQSTTGKLAGASADALLRTFVNHASRDIAAGDTPAPPAGTQ